MFFLLGIHNRYYNFLFAVYKIGTRSVSMNVPVELLFLYQIYYDILLS